MSAKVFECLGHLEYEEAKGDGLHPDADDGFERLLEARLRTIWTRPTERNLHGVNLLAYDAYDGRPSALLFATGLGEGDYPVVPQRWDLEEEAVARRLGLLEPDESQEDYVHQELERQIRLACAAFDACDGKVTLSYATEGPGTEQRYPGALLSLLVGGWSEADWHSDNERVEVFTWSDEIPEQPSDALCWNDVALFADDPKFRRWLRELDDDALTHDDHQRKRLFRDNTELLGSSREAFRERHPRPDELPRFGEFSGMLPGSTRPPEAYSASALQAYGQCGTKYFLGKLLRVSDTTELSESLEATETGTIIHNAFADAAHEVVDRLDGTLWSMCIEPDETKEEAVERRRLGYEISQKIREVLIGDEPFGYLDPLARTAVENRREWMRPLLETAPAPIVFDEGQTTWWSFAGGRINSTVRYLLKAVGHDVRADNFRVTLDGQGLREALGELAAPGRLEELRGDVLALLPEYRLSKFQRALPDWAAAEIVEAYLLDQKGTAEFLTQR